MHSSVVCLDRRVPRCRALTTKGSDCSVALMQARAGKGGKAEPRDPRGSERRAGGGSRARPPPRPPPRAPAAPRAAVRLEGLPVRGARGPRGCGGAAGRMRDPRPPRSHSSRAEEEQRRALNPNLFMLGPQTATTTAAVMNWNQDKFINCFFHGNKNID
ncbi:uncharacterized protein LOC129402403 isoform X3 [Sorex araneus]|uniref:uncharacterized protein LOC129402403 isoform X3 n=1 Tax=Sorex araneus TaxID=42254 RepID=UPI002433FD46|nr:uncharacterized protein LOC129402403 isoform X3 [Sorex araneus]